MAFLKLVFLIYIIVLAFGALCSVFRFLFDIKRFKDKEERFKLFDETIKEIKEIKEKTEEEPKGDVSENGV